MNKKCVIIGGGIGGLFTGALLSKNGYIVTVLEKNAIIGGGLQCFRRDGKIFETGMHVAGGLEPGDSLYRICKYLEVYDKLDIQHVPHGCIDEIYYHKTGERFLIASGKKGFPECLGKYFPNEKENLISYVNELFRLTDEVPLFTLREGDDYTRAHSENFLIAADELIDKYIDDPKLREILAYLNPLYSGVKGQTPAYIHALLNVLYIKGTSRFTGGSQQLADALKEVIVGNGGRVLDNTTVSEVNISDKHVNYVRTTDGSMFEADCYVSAIHPVELIRISSAGSFRKSFIDRMNEIPQSTSAFSVYIDLKPGRFRYIDHTCYYMEDYGAMWDQNDTVNRQWPSGFMYMTPPDYGQGKYASRLLVHAIMDFDEVRKWEDTKTGNRGPEYERWKQKYTDRIISKLETMFPGFIDMIQHVYSASPLTIRDYYNTKNGAIFGYRKDCRNLIFSQLTVYTKIDNLYLTGQNIILHGICGVPLTAIKTAEAILGKNVIIDQINAKETNK